mmetsp:Transcript_32505/g.76366  ORF Transcript_32505/g.76366 Transcript_32505/m.76366 type:complete len:236 (-) Transcript_32505:761-1468(-)
MSWVFRSIFSNIPTFGFSSSISAPNWRRRSSTSAFLLRFCRLGNWSRRALIQARSSSADSVMLEPSAALMCLSLWTAITCSGPEKLQSGSSQGMWSSATCSSYLSCRLQSLLQTWQNHSETLRPLTPDHCRPPHPLELPPDLRSWSRSCHRESLCRLSHLHEFDDRGYESWYVFRFCQSPQSSSSASSTVFFSSALARKSSASSATGSADTGASASSSISIASKSSARSSCHPSS